LGPGFHTGGFTVAFGHGHPLVKCSFLRSTHPADNACYRCTSKIVPVLLRWSENGWKARTGTSGHGPWPQVKVAGPGDQTGQLLLWNLPSRFHHLLMLSQAATAMPGALPLVPCQKIPRLFPGPTKAAAAVT
jgi:hypothetical protein